MGLANDGSKIDFALSEFGMTDVNISLLACRGAKTFFADRGKFRLRQ